MNKNPVGQRITATFTIEGNAESILTEVRRLRHIGERSVLLTVRLPMVGTPQNGEDYGLPLIRAGNTSGTFEYLEKLMFQCRIDDNTNQRLANLIEEFGRLTE